MGQKYFLPIGEAGGRRRPPGLKSFLISLNIQMDWLLDKIRSIEWSGDPIIFEWEMTKIERLTLLLEDKRFYNHSGFDWWCIPRMLRQALTFKRIGGVSTIEQQLVRTILSRRERTIRRKSREVLLAWLLVHRKSKREILRAYLATAYFGYRLRGCDQTAKFLFGKCAGELNVEQASLVASLLVYPLPKLVRNDANCMATLPTAEAIPYLDLAAVVAPKWARRVKRRMNYGIALNRDSK